MKDETHFLRVSKGKHQNRITLPKNIESTYVAVKPVHDGIVDFIKLKRDKKR